MQAHSFSRVKLYIQLQDAIRAISWSFVVIVGKQWFQSIICPRESQRCRLMGSKGTISRTTSTLRPKPILGKAANSKLQLFNFSAVGYVRFCLIKCKTNFLFCEIILFFFYFSLCSLVAFAALYFRHVTTVLNTKILSNGDLRLSILSLSHS